MGKPGAGADSSATSAAVGAVGVRSRKRRFQMKSDRPLPPPLTRQMRRRASEFIAMLVLPF